MSIYNPRVRFDVVLPDGMRYDVASDVAGWLDNRQWLVDTLLHGYPVGTAIHNLRQVTRAGKDFRNQPPMFAAPAPVPHDFHVGKSKALRSLFKPKAAQADEADAIPGTRAAAGVKLGYDPAKVLTASYVPDEDDEDPYDIYPGVRAYRPPAPSPNVPIPPPTMAVPDPTHIDEPVGDPAEGRVVRRTVNADPADDEPKKE